MIQEILYFFFIVGIQDDLPRTVYRYMTYMYRCCLFLQVGYNGFFDLVQKIILLFGRMPVFGIMIRNDLNKNRIGLMFPVWQVLQVYIDDCKGRIAFHFKFKTGISGFFTVHLQLFILFIRFLFFHHPHIGRKVLITTPAQADDDPVIFIQAELL